MSTQTPGSVAVPTPRSERKGSLGEEEEEANASVGKESDEFSQSSLESTFFSSDEKERTDFEDLLELTPERFCMVLMKRIGVDGSKQACV